MLQKRYYEFYSNRLLQGLQWFSALLFRRKCGFIDVSHQQRRSCRNSGPSQTRPSAPYFWSCVPTDARNPVRRHALARQAVLSSRHLQDVAQSGPNPNEPAGK